MPRASRFSLLVLLLLATACSDRAADGPLAPPDADARWAEALEIEVMTQNLYLGVGLDRLLNATTPEEILAGFQELQTTNAFDAAYPMLGPARLREVARQIAEASPHLVGLQEVSTYIFSQPGSDPLTLDFLTVLMYWLYRYQAEGLTDYTYVPVVNPSVAAPPLTLPLPTGPITVQYFDADAILVRSDVPMIAPPVNAIFDAVQTFTVFGIPFPFYRGYQTVTVAVDGQPLVFANTHLEVQRFEAVQLAQTAEMIAALDEVDLPVIAVGDFNSAANHDAPEDQTTATYRMLRNAGFADLWLRGSHSVGGVTCCQAGNLTNEDSELTQRLDLVLARWGPAGFGGQSEVEVLGEEPGDRLSFLAVDPFTTSVFPLTLWRSDHAGVAATLWPAPGRVHATFD
jgi:endonuclease/exonuclease/phosphatase family metal-dependent hydrolase